MTENSKQILKILPVSRETETRLRHFSQLFQKWAAKMNLVAPSTLGDIWNRHIVDSLQIYSLFPGPKRWVDMGTGGGFPGIITAICLAEKGDGWVYMLESNAKKSAFLRTAIAETGARASVHNVRIETARDITGDCDAISARALADLSLLLDYSAPWLLGAPAVRAFFHKGREYQQELDKAVGRWQFDLVKHPSVVEQDSVVLEIKNLSRFGG
ncbi:16S rRNA (guanine(527)-N(7))-methyltransferase RsmG [Pararhizobium sp.]|uniref:16S rRNA (guanine(527)-N(7))-methyltransferase RsmG n=1 Tax=Pararhizobium sp. TaxID=1977563 RepID=UPI0027200923|nr:16S rRNA (guanine(527)-N(7))-methyltransferase RsmG [Pararhizobium sp.]MDO9416792.1 16S rRNA (guanine(527)-N(7))-methyltransferase RsmG [Pararhizobium sp.]